MKRIISLCCVALLLIQGLALPVHASEISNEVGLELLDYCTVNNSGSNFFSFNNEVNIQFTPPGRLTCTYIDMIIQVVSGPGPSSAIVWWSNRQYSLTCEPIGDGFWRIHGSMRFDGYWNISVNLYTAGGGTSYYELWSCRVSSYDTHFTTPAHGNGYFGNNGVISMAADPSDPRARYQYIDPTGQSTMSYWFDVTFPEWIKYDYVDVIISYRGLSITSISGFFEDYMLPLTTSEYVSNENGETYFLITARLDLRGLAKSSSMDPAIRFTGELLPNTTCYLQIMTASGFLQFSRSPLYYYFTQLGNNLSSWFSSLGSTISTGFNNLNGLIDRQTNTIGTWFSNLNGWIDNQTKVIVSALTLDTAPGDSFQQQVSNKDQQLNDMAAIMGSISKPSPDDFDVSLDNYVNDSDIQVLATPINVLLEAELFSRIIFIALILATVSFVLYGKR